MAEPRVLVEVGRRAPAFVLRDSKGEAVSLESLLGGPLVLYFYPKADTTSCTAQACAFNEALGELTAAGARVVGVSPDGPAALAAFARKFKLGFPLLGDPPVAAGEAPAVLMKYGVWGEKSMYGRTYMGVVRTTYLLDADGTVVRRWDGVKVPGHAAEVMAAIAGGGGGSNGAGAAAKGKSKAEARVKAKPGLKGNEGKAKTKAGPKAKAVLKAAAGLEAKARPPRKPKGAAGRSARGRDAKRG